MTKAPRHCTHCGKLLDVDLPGWKTMHPKCFSEFKRAESVARDAEIAKLRDELDGLQNFALLLDADDLKFLIRVCHPDLHGGDLKAADLTRRLIKTRRRARR